MTVAALTQTRAQIAGDGVTDRVDVTFQFVDQTDLKVIHTDSQGTNTEWTFQESPGSWYFTGGEFAAGTIHFTASDLTIGERLTVLLTSQYDQTLSLDGGEIDPSVLERGMDRAALQIQSIAGEVGRALRVSPSSSGNLPDLEVPDLPDGHTFVRDGDELIPALIDSAAISTAVTAAEFAQAAAVTAQEDAEIARDAATSAASSATTAEANAGSSAGVAVESATAAATSASSAAQSATDAANNATEVLGYGRIPVGAMLPWASPRTPNQFWALITEPGQVYNRVTYPALHDVLAPELPLNIGMSSNTGVSSDPAWDQIPVGAPVEGAGIPSGTTVTSAGYESLLSAYVVGLSQAATAPISEVRVFPHGNGDGSTTSSYPDTAGRVHRALDLSSTVNPSGSRLGDMEEDAMQRLTGMFDQPYSGRTTVDPDRYEGVFTGVNGTYTGANGSAGNNIIVEFDSGNSPGARVSDDETRVKSWVGPYIIKVADGVDNEAMLNAVQVVQDTATALSKALANKAEVAKFGSVAVLQYQLPYGNNGGAAIAGSRQTYPLNTEVYDPNGIISLASYQFMAAVDMEVDFWALFYSTAQTKTYIRNITDGVDVAVSGKAYIRAGSFSTGHVAGRALLEAGKTYELQYEVATTKTSQGLGIGAGSPTGVEVYGQLNARAI